MAEAGLPVMDNPSHIVPVMVGDPVHCKAVTDTLLDRLRHLCAADQLSDRAARHRAHALDPDPIHTDEQMDYLVSAR